MPPKVEGSKRARRLPRRGRLLPLHIDGRSREPELQTKQTAAVSENPIAASHCSSVNLLSHVGAPFPSLYRGLARGMSKLIV